MMPRQIRILQLLAKEQGLSTNHLYVMTSPACIRTGRRRSHGTNGWDMPARMMAEGLVLREVDMSLVDRFAQQNPQMTPKAARHAARHRVRYHWYITDRGREILQESVPVG